MTRLAKPSHPVTARSGGNNLHAGTTVWEDMRCGKCEKLLGKAETVGNVQIKCRCGTLNHFRAESPSPERHGAPEKGVVHGRKGFQSQEPASGVGRG